MKAWQLTGSEGQAALVQAEVVQPVPGAGEILVRVRAAGVTPTELLWYPTQHTKSGAPRTGAVPSHEFSGEVAGEEVYGMNDWFEDGALAEYCVSEPRWIAPKPRGLSHAEAAAVPIGALTAWQGLFERAKLQAGERVLVHGGAGAVGVFAIQLARARGARVMATVSERNVEFVKGLGADEAIDYRTTAFEDVARDIDVVFDAVGGDTLRRSWKVLKADGRMVTIAAAGESAQEERVKAAFFIMEPNRQQLVEIGLRIEAGELRVVVDTVVPFEQAGQAYAGAVARSGRGKMVVAA